MESDTIAAIATPPGRGGIGIIRISGPAAEKILGKVFSTRAMKNETGCGFESHRLMYGKLTYGGEVIDECMAVLMRAPKSYTREDVAEIHVHGGAYVINQGLEACLHEGARLAENGEFTRRAFENGRIDLAQAEAVMSLISAQGKQEHRAAIRQINGGTSAFVRKISDRLSELQAGLAAWIDYPDEISDDEGIGQLREGLEELIKNLEDAIDEHASRMLHQGLQVALIGRPNVGKSSLLNALTGEELAIVTEIPGTTRDTVRGEITLNGLTVFLTDTAGIRETDDPVEIIGVKRSEMTMKQADVSLLVLDGSEPMTENDLELLDSLNGEAAVIINKSDLARHVTKKTIEERKPGIPCFTVSAMVTDTLDPVREYLCSQSEVSDQLEMTQPRHLEAARRALGHLRDAMEALEIITPDAAATDLQVSQAALSEITGDQADEKLLDVVFSRFCVGK